jgi:hypothetical protein
LKKLEENTKQLNSEATKLRGGNKMFSIFKKLKKSKKAYSTGFAWIFGLVTLFGLGILYIVFNQVFLGYLVPTIKTQVNTSNIAAATQLEINSGIDKYMAFFHILPFVIFFVVIIYMIVVAIRKEREGEFQ